MTQLTPSEYRIVQTLLNLPNPVHADLLNLAAANGRTLDNRLSTQHIARIRRKRPDLRITSKYGSGYSIRFIGIECDNCPEIFVVPKGKRKPPWCSRCMRMFDLGYKVARQKFETTSVVRKVSRSVTLQPSFGPAQGASQGMVCSAARGDGEGGQNREGEEGFGIG